MLSFVAQTMRSSSLQESKVAAPRPAIPVVRHAIKNDGRARKDFSPKPVELSRVIQLLEDPFSETLKERQLFLLKKVTKRYQNGIPLKDLANIFKIVNICATKIKDHPQYTPIICDILQICGLPFSKERSSDEINYVSTVKESFAQMGYLMRVPSTDVRLQICASIISQYNPPMNKHYPEGYWPTSIGFIVQMMEQSGLAETLVLSMALLEHQLQVKLQVLRVLQVLSSSSDVNCRLILKAQGACKICSSISQPDPSGQLLFRSSEVLWNLLEKGNTEEVTSQLCDMDCILCLKEAFLNQLMNGFRRYDLHLRNDLLLIISLIAENPNAPLIESGLATQLVQILTFPEIKSHSPLLVGFKIAFNNEDFEMKKLLLNIIVVMAKDLSALQLFRDSRVLLALMHHASPDRKLERRGWSSGQQEELQLQALATLASVAPLLVDDYMNCQGNTRLLLLLEWCTKRDAYLGRPGHCFHGTGERGSKKAQMRYCLRLLRAMVSLANETLNQDLCDQGAIGQLLEMMIFEGSSAYEDSVAMEIKTDIQLILSLLCEDNVHRKELFGSDGVEMTVHLLKISTTKFYSGLGHNRLILSTTDCIRSCIVGCYTTEDLFLEKGGAHLLLDLLQSTPRSVHNEIVGTLLELCDNPKTLSCIRTWRGQEGQSAAAIFIQLWKEEEKALGVRRDPHGRIADTKKPILAAYQDGPPTPLPADKPSAAVVDVTENLRSKIYSMFCHMGFDDLPGLVTEDGVTLAIIRRYLDFKVGEIWGEVYRELEAEGVRPVSPDRMVLESVIQAAEQAARAAVSHQAELLQSQWQLDAEEEQLTYSEIRSNHKQEELIVKSWEHFVAKTSDHKILQEAKKYQEKSIESSRKKINSDGSVFHPTHIAELNVTAFSGRVVTVDSTPAHLTQGHVADKHLALERVPIEGGEPQTLPPASQDRD